MFERTESLLRGKYHGVKPESYFNSNKRPFPGYKISQNVTNHTYLGESLGSNGDESEYIFFDIKPCILVNFY